MPAVLIIMVVLPKRMRQVTAMFKSERQKGSRLLVGGGVVKILANDDFSSSKYIECCF